MVKRQSRWSFEPAYIADVALESDCTYFTIDRRWDESGSTIGRMRETKTRKRGRKENDFLFCWFKEMTTIREMESKNQLIEEAKSIGIKNAASLRKKELKEVIANKRKVKDDEDTDTTICCIHGNEYHVCSVCRRKRLCIHGKTKYYCKACGGSLICKHDKKIFNCYHCSEERRQKKKNKWTECVEKVKRNLKEEREKIGFDPVEEDTMSVTSDFSDHILVEEGSGCFIDGFDDVCDYVAYLNARDD